MGSILYYITVILFTVVYFLLFTVVFFLTVLFDKERVVMHYASIIWAQGVFRINPLWKIKVDGKENIDNKKPYVIIVNHQQMTDIPLMYVVPLKFKWVAKQGVYRWPIFGWVMRMHGDIAIERGSSSAMRKLITNGKKRLDNGTSIIIFPEGTRTKDGKIMKFKEGAFVLAKQAGVDILPCVLEGTGTMLKGWKISMPHTFRVRILPPVSAQYIAQHEPKDLAAEIQQTMSLEHDKLIKL